MYPSPARAKTRSKILLRMSCAHTCTVLKMPFTQGCILFFSVATYYERKIIPSVHFFSPWSANSDCVNSVTFGKKATKCSSGHEECDFDKTVGNRLLEVRNFFAEFQSKLALLNIFQKKVSTIIS